MRKLGATTLVPDELYIRRAADTQLANAIHDMGRPAYILVARQMGKTNLLIHAKKTLETENDIFVYVDLSNKYETDRECFQSIIDKILDINEMKLPGVDQSIQAARINLKLAPHREHSSELRKILAVIAGKLIINLDEVDSLTAAEYSDKIFAQIRSVYFDRISYPEFERLGYVISGVAEPSEIIKDKSISPFNIGQKVLLGDFTKSEYGEFISKCGLDTADSELIEQIFHWSNGNPRMTWDICAEFEKQILEGQSLSTKKIDNIVHDMYFATYDKPPVDHIRSLMRSNRELRQAVMSIYYGKSDTISEEHKNKLYLSGILGSNYEFGDVQIKNRIVENSISEQWLTDIERREIPSSSEVEKCMSNGQYKLAADICEQILENPNSISTDIKTARHTLGLAMFYLGNYAKTIECFKDNMYDKLGLRDAYLDQVLMLGISHSQLQNHKEAFLYFDELVELDSSKHFHVALINKAAMSLRLGTKDSEKDAVATFKKIIDGNDSGDSVSSDALAAAHYNLAALYENKEPREAFTHYLASAKAAQIKKQAAPLSNAIRLFPENIEECWDDLIFCFSSGDIILDDGTGDLELDFNISKLSDLISLLFKENFLNKLDRLLEQVRDTCLIEPQSYGDIMLELGLNALTNSKHDEASWLLHSLSGLDRTFTSPITIFNSKKLISFIDSSNEEAGESYFKGFQNYTDSVALLDALLFERAIAKHLEQNDTETARRYCDLFISVEGDSERSKSSLLVRILFYRMQSLSNGSEKLSQAIEIKNIIQSLTEHDIKYHNELFNKSLDSIRAIVNSTIITLGKTKTYTHRDRKYGRNERVKIEYPDGRIEEKKYKFVQESISRSLCKIVL